MNSFMSWVGGKKALRDDVIIRMPPFYEKYVEVFGGAGWVLFRKSHENEVEVFNDFNSNLVNLYRCVRDNPAKLKYKLRYVLNSREDFRWIAYLHKKRPVSEVSRLRQGGEVLSAYSLQLRQYAGQLCKSATFYLGRFSADRYGFTAFTKSNN